MMFSQQNDPASIKADFEKDLKGNPELIQKKLNIVNDLIKNEKLGGCVRMPPSTIRGPMPSLLQKYFMEKEILEEMLKKANMVSQPNSPKQC